MVQKYQLGFFARIMRNISERKNVRVLQSKEVLIGEDEFGNTYYEIPSDSRNNLKFQRRIEPLNPDQFQKPDIPVEWITWLQGRRKEPPSIEEIEQNYISMVNTKYKADQLDAKRKPPETVEEIDPSTLNKKREFPRYDDYEDVLRSVEQGTYIPPSIKSKMKKK